MPSFSLVLLKVPLGHHNFHPYYDVLFFFHFSRKVISLQLATSTMTRSKKKWDNWLWTIETGQYGRLRVRLLLFSGIFMEMIWEKKPLATSQRSGKELLLCDALCCNAILLWFVLFFGTHHQSIIPLVLEILGLNGVIRKSFFEKAGLKWKIKRTCNNLSWDSPEMVCSETVCSKIVCPEKGLCCDGLSQDGLSRDGLSRDGLSWDCLSRYGLSPDGLSRTVYA